MPTGNITHTAQATHIYRYRFTCEHCGKDSGLLSAAEVGYGSVSAPPKSALTPQQRAEVQCSAQASLDAAIAARKQKFALGRYGGRLKGKCPHCGRRQSWELQGTRAKPWQYAVYGAAAGLMIMAVAMLIDQQIGNYLSVCVPVGFGLGLLIGYTRRVKTTVDTRRTAERNLPEVIW